MSPRKTPDPRPAPPVIYYAPLGELKVFEISEAELEKLESGPAGQIHLNFALAMLPTALSIFIALQTATFSPAWNIAYQVAGWVLGGQGVLALVQWWYKSRDFRTLVQDIRARMPDRPGIPEQLPLLTSPSDQEPDISQ